MTEGGIDILEGWDAPIPSLEVELDWALEVFPDGCQDSIWPAAEGWSQLTEAPPAEVDALPAELQWQEVLECHLEFDPAELVAEDFR